MKEETGSVGQVDRMAAYRQSLINADHVAAGDFDKAIMTLAGGALGLSLGFLRPGSSPQASWTLATAWGLLVLSLLSTLISFLSSQEALRKAIWQLDHGSIHRQQAGGWFSSFTRALNYAAAFCFILGLAFLTAFTWLNVERLGKS